MTELHDTATGTKRLSSWCAAAVSEWHGKCRPSKWSRCDCVRHRDINQPLIARRRAGA